MRTGSRISVTNTPVARLRSERAEPRGLLQRLASDLRASLARGWGSIPRSSKLKFAFGKKGRLEDTRRFRRACATAFSVCASMPAWATHHADAFAKIPDGLSVILFSTYEDPNVVAYDPDVLDAEGLATFANDLCGHNQARTEHVSPYIFQRVQGHKRAHIFCLGDPK